MSARTSYHSLKSWRQWYMSSFPLPFYYFFTYLQFWSPPVEPLWQSFSLRYFLSKFSSLLTDVRKIQTVKLLKSSLSFFLLSLSLPCLQVSGINASLSKKREQRVLFMVVIMVICYLLCWLPYGIMALLATFGPPGLVSPEASIIPSVLAKTSTVINPVIYVFMNKQVSGSEPALQNTEVKWFYMSTSCCLKISLPLKCWKKSNTQEKSHDPKIRQQDQR